MENLSFCLGSQSPKTGMSVPDWASSAREWGHAEPACLALLTHEERGGGGEGMDERDGEVRLTDTVRWADTENMFVNKIKLQW